MIQMNDRNILQSNSFLANAPIFWARISLLTTHPGENNASA
jgi:hypothetical protein